MTEEPKPDRRPDPRADAERRLRMAMAAEARQERALRSTIQKGFYGCITVFVVFFLIALFFF